jgi:hypothetical protein
MPTTLSDQFWRPTGQDTLSGTTVSITTPKLLLSSTSAPSTSWHACLISEIFVSSAAFPCVVYRLLLMPRSTCRFYARTYWEDDGNPYQQAQRLERGCGLGFLKHSKIRGWITSYNFGEPYKRTVLESQSSKTNDTAYGAAVAADPIDVPYITTLRAEEHQEICW